MPEHADWRAIERHLERIADCLEKIAYPDVYILKPPLLEETMVEIRDAIIHMAYPEGKMVEEFLADDDS